MIGVNHQNMNGTNKYVLLKSVLTQAPISRVELSQITGLNKMTITGLINEYIEKGIVWECGESNSTGGRKRAYLDVVPDSLLTLGIYIGRDTLLVGIINLKGQILQSESMELSFMENNDVFIKGLFMLCDRLLNTKYKEYVWGIGVSCAGPLLAQDGVILNPPDFNNIKDLPIVDKLKERYNLPAYLQNDMCVAALAEVYFGNKQKYNNFIYVGISSGIGGGVIIDKKIYTGSSGLAGVIGHSIVEMNGILCECGQCGCLEKYSSTRATVRWAKENGASQDLTWMSLLDKASNGDDICTKAIERMINYLEVAIINMESAYDTECFVIGGDLHFYQDLVVKRIQDKLRKQAFSWGKTRDIQVEASSFMGSASFIGTVALVMENNLVR